METTFSAANFLDALVGGRVNPGDLYEPHFGYLRSLWIVPTILGGLLAITLLGRFAATASYYSLEAAKEKLKSLKPRGLGARVREAVGGGSSHDTGHDDDGIVPVSVMAGERMDEPASRGSTAVYGDEDADKSEDDESSWLRRWERGAEAARTVFFLSFVIATVGSLPIEYDCQRGSTGVVPNCTVCVTNAAQMSLVILAWVFLAFSVVWVLLDVALSHRSSVAGNRLMMTFFAQPIVVVSLVLAFRRWNMLRARTCGDH
ncbi:hypothetical protein HDU87_003830 [Geranomyces variabilis]|uniref:Transmembrane protein n=1 Tax=Geranomyces variabilis TaxID=109894 RepID=A0AAD5XM94_9FUNG|nr:hypothetical protein HDU87_003830 [Geranomyces variabilis]